MGLQTGSKLAVTKYPIIDPSNLKILAYEVEGPLLAERPSLLRIADVREISNIGMIIDGNDEFIGLNDVIKIEKIYQLSFKLIDLKVIDEHKRKLGKVTDYSVDVSNFVIQQLTVKPTFIKSLSESELLIHRSQIIEIDDEKITVRAATKKLSALQNINNLNYFNPFKTSDSQTENKNI